MVLSKVVGELIDKCVVEFRKEENMERINKNVIDPLIYHLLKNKQSDVITISPPLNLTTKEFGKCPAYTISKYNMSMVTLALSQAYKKDGLRANSLWPKTTVDSAAVRNLFPPQVLQASRKPSIVADAAFGIIQKPATSFSGHFLLDEDFLRSEGTEDFSQ